MLAAALSPIPATFSGPSEPARASPRRTGGQEAPPPPAASERNPLAAVRERREGEGAGRGRLRRPCRRLAGAAVGKPSGDEKSQCSKLDG